MKGSTADWGKEGLQRYCIYGKFRNYSAIERGRTGLRCRFLGCGVAECARELHVAAKALAHIARLTPRPGARPQPDLVPAPPASHAHSSPADPVTLRQQPSDVEMGYIMGRDQGNLVPLILLFLVTFIFCFHVWCVHPRPAGAQALLNLAQPPAAWPECRTRTGGFRLARPRTQRLHRHSALSRSMSPPQGRRVKPDLARPHLSDPQHQEGTWPALKKGLDISVLMY